MIQKQDFEKSISRYHDYDKVIRDMISKEFDRQHSFIRLHIAMQTILFATFALISTLSLILVIILIGILSSICAFATYMASEIKIKRIFYFWDGYLNVVGSDYFEYPPVWSNPAPDKDINKNLKAIEYFGLFEMSCFRRLCLGLILPKTSPFIFLIAWIILLLVKIHGLCICL